MANVRVYFEGDEWYPVYIIEEECGENCTPTWHEIPESKYTEWMKIFEAFDKMQDEIMKLIDEGDDNER